MLGCSYGNLFITTVGGGSYQDGLTIHIQGIPPGYLFTEEEIYSELMLRKPGQGKLTSPRKEADIPIIFSGINTADTMPGYRNEGLTNGTPLVILIPNVDRHFEHIEQYRSTNRTPRPGHASYASFKKYGDNDDSIGAGFFSGRYTSTIVAAGAIAKRVLKDHGIIVTAYVKEAAGISMPKMDIQEIREKGKNYRSSRKEIDPVYREIFGKQLFKKGMRFFEKAKVLSSLEKKIQEVSKVEYDEKMIREKYEVHPALFCPHMETADKMTEEIIRIAKEGDSSGGIVEVVVTGLPAGIGEPVFSKLDGEMAGLMNIGAIKGVEIGSGMATAKMKGSESNDQMRVVDKEVIFLSNNAGGITGGLSTGQDIVARVAVKPTPTIAKDQETIDKVSMKNITLGAVTRRDPTIVARIWPVVEAYTAMVVLDSFMHHNAYKTLKMD